MMFIPERIKGELEALEADDDPLANLRSLKVLRDWLHDMEIRSIEAAQDQGRSFQQLAEVQERPRQAVHRTLKHARSRGLSDPVFDGVTSSTLRYWLDWWSAPERTPDGAEEDGRDPATEADRVRVELEARGAAGLLRKSV